MQLRKMTHVHVEELVGNSFLPMANTLNSTHLLQRYYITVHVPRYDRSTIQPWV